MDPSSDQEDGRNVPDDSTDGAHSHSSNHDGSTAEDDTAVGEAQAYSDDASSNESGNVPPSEDAKHAEADASPPPAVDPDDDRRTTNLKSSAVARAITEDEGDKRNRSDATATAATGTATESRGDRVGRAAAKMRRVNERANRIRKSDAVNSAMVSPRQARWKPTSKGGDDAFHKASLDAEIGIENEQASGVLEVGEELEIEQGENQDEESNHRIRPGAFAVSNRVEYSSRELNASSSGHSSVSPSEEGGTEMQVMAFAVDVDEEMRETSNQALSKIELERLQNTVRLQILSQAVQAEVVEEDKVEGTTFGMCACFPKRGRKRKTWVSVAAVVVAAAAIGLSVGLSERGNGASEVSSIARTGSTKAPSTFDAVMERGVLRCGVSDIELPGFSVLDQGELVGFDIDLCRAVAAAAFGDPNLIELVRVTSVNRFVSLATYEEAPDLLSQGDTHNFERDIYQPDAGVGFTFSTPYLYDGLAFAGVPQYVSCAEKHTIAGSCEDLRVCVVMSSSWKDVVSSILPGSSIVRTETAEQYFEKLTSGECNVLAGEMRFILEEAARVHGYEGGYLFGRHFFSKEPLAIVTREGDAKWSDFVDWVLHALLAAEEKNITQSTAELFPATTVFGDQHQDMFRNAIAAVGNYGEMYARHLQPFLPRKEINMVNTGETGLIYSHPFGRLSIGGPGPVEGGILERILSRGHLLCGLSSDNFAGQNQDSAGREWTGLDADFCRAVGAAIFEGSPDSVVFVEAGNDEGFEVLAKGEIDVLSGAGNNLERYVNQQGSGPTFSFSQPYYYVPLESQDGDGETRALATWQEDAQWSGFVYWVVAATFYAEEMKFTQDMPNAMPEVNLFGPMFVRMFRDALVAVGNYAEMYERSEKKTVLPPRSGRNLQNVIPFGPQFHPLPFDFE